MNKSRLFAGVITLILALAVVLSFAGCKKQKDDNKDNDTSSNVISGTLDENTSTSSDDFAYTLPEDVIYDGQASSEASGSSNSTSSGTQSGGASNSSAASNSNGSASSSASSSGGSSSSANSSSEVSSVLPDLGGPIVLPEVEF